MKPFITAPGLDRIFLIIGGILMVPLALTCKSGMEAYNASQLSKIQSFVEPKFIPNSSDILYINNSSGNFELWKLSATGEPRKVTDLNQRINNLQISKDGKYGFFAADSGGNERFDIFKYEIISGVVSRISNTSRISETGFHISPDGNSIAYEADNDIPFRPQIFVMDVQKQTSLQVTKGDIPTYNPIWSNNGNLIAAVKTGDHRMGKLLLIDIIGKSIDTINPKTENNILIPFHFFPDDKSLLCKTKNEAGFYQLAIVDIKSHDIKLIGPARWDVEDAMWNKNSGIFFSQNIRGRTAIFRMKDPESQYSEVIPSIGNISHFNVNTDASNLLFSRQDGNHPQELYRFDLKTNKIQQLTDACPAEIDPEQLSKSEQFSIRSFDSTIVEGFYYRPGKKYSEPLAAILLVHGGPGGMDRDEFSIMTQSLTQAGFFVIRINYRGSSGYGKAFEDLNNKDWGGGDRKDLRIVAEYFIKQGLIDKDKIGITGDSYGGYMTLMAMTKDADFYAAGAEAYGMADLIYDYYLTKDRWGLWYETEMGIPSKDSALFADRSPMNFLDKLNAPIIIFQGANDSNVPKNESDLVFNTLLKLGNEPEYVVYPDEGHGFTRRVNINDWIQKTVDFFQRKLKE